MRTEKISVRSMKSILVMLEKAVMTEEIAPVISAKCRIGQEKKRTNKPQKMPRGYKLPFKLHINQKPTKCFRLLPRPDLPHDSDCSAHSRHDYHTNRCHDTIDTRQ